MGEEKLQIELRNVAVKSHEHLYTLNSECFLWGSPRVGRGGNYKYFLHVLRTSAEKIYLSEVLSIGKPDFFSHVRHKFYLSRTVGQSIISIPVCGVLSKDRLHCHKVLITQPGADSGGRPKEPWPPASGKLQMYNTFQK